MVLESLQVAEHIARRGCGKSAIVQARLSVTQHDCSLDCLTRDKRSPNVAVSQFYLFHAYTTTEKTEQINYWYFAAKLREKKPSQKKKIHNTCVPFLIFNGFRINYILKCMCYSSLHFVSFFLHFYRSCVPFHLHISSCTYIWFPLFDCSLFQIPNSNTQIPLFISFFLFVPFFSVFIRFF